MHRSDVLKVVMKLNDLKLHFDHGFHFHSKLILLVFDKIYQYSK
jgi:hypothetical protein